jgi:hypothetical protein
MQGNIYSNFLLKIVSGEINWVTDSIKCVFCDSSYNPDKNFHKTLSDVTGIIEGFDLNISNRDIVLDNDCIYFKGDNIVLDNLTLPVTKVRGFFGGSRKSISGIRSSPKFRVYHRPS